MALILPVKWDSPIAFSHPEFGDQPRGCKAWMGVVFEAYTWTLHCTLFPFVPQRPRSWCKSISREKLLQATPFSYLKDQDEWTRYSLISRKAPTTASLLGHGTHPHLRWVVLVALPSVARRITLSRVWAHPEWRVIFSRIRGLSRCWARTLLAIHIL